MKKEEFSQKLENFKNDVLKQFDQMTANNHPPTGFILVGALCDKEGAAITNSLENVTGHDVIDVLSRSASKIVLRAKK